ncbi:hypothetical protein [Clostridium scatologenes]|uniref:Uncharacterized protein n=1 Tax=Clostridium scatologenes TaxID=1548 RepID=A0A0E3GRK4_CLOSL|nr:hypothetical protein [Clostridium scatologenes]AKA70476.1 hypothetical protein CSCA_3351 [Clostridium scatologenes]
MINKLVQRFETHLEEEVIDYTPNVLSWLILSDEVISIFNKLDIRQFQAFSVKLINKFTKDKSKFSNVINITCDKSVLNWEKSGLVTWDDDPKQWHSAFLLKLICWLS